jgi:hypothetical protein
MVAGRKRRLASLKVRTMDDTSGLDPKRKGNFGSQQGRRTDEDQLPAGFRASVRSHLLDARR